MYQLVVNEFLQLFSQYVCLASQMCLKRLQMSQRQKREFGCIVV